jgi:tRNA-specific 2-thiouridylase
LACNRDLKFRALLNRALGLGYEYVATGHYARIQSADSGFQLLRAIDPEKDQSYMLHILGQHELSRLNFPIGHYTKAQVRELAAARGLSSADRPESQDICFVPGGDYRNLLREERPEALAPGPIVDQQGREVGQHQGLPLYTIGQRRGIGVAAGQPIYVTEIDPTRNTLVVGPASALERSMLNLDSLTFVAGTPPDTSFECMVQIRAHATPVPARVTLGEGDQATVTFARPQRAITPGQSAVFYTGEITIGGGRIKRDEWHQRSS